MGRNTGTNGRLRNVLAVGVVGVFALVLTACPPPPAPTTTTTPSTSTTLLAESAGPECDGYTPAGIGVSANFITTGDNITVIGFVQAVAGKGPLTGGKVEIRMVLASDPSKGATAPWNPVGIGTIQNESGYFYGTVQIPTSTQLANATFPAAWQTYWKFEVKKLREDNSVCPTKASATVAVIG